jgi:hypothetical protein
MRKLLCWLGWHSLEFVPPCSSEEMGTKMAQAKSGEELLGVLFGGIMACKHVCKHCGHEVRT